MQFEQKIIFIKNAYFRQIIFLLMTAYYMYYHNTIYWSPRYNCNIIESGVQHHKPTLKIGIWWNKEPTTWKIGEFDFAFRFSSVSYLLALLLVFGNHTTVLFLDLWGRSPSICFIYKTVVGKNTSEWWIYYRVFVTLYWTPLL